LARKTAAAQTRTSTRLGVSAHSTDASFRNDVSKSWPTDAPDSVASLSKCCKQAVVQNSANAPASRTPNSHKVEDIINPIEHKHILTERKSSIVEESDAAGVGRGELAGNRGAGEEVSGALEAKLADDT
jgi:hypothetical protein